MIRLLSMGDSIPRTTFYSIVAEGGSKYIGNTLQMVHFRVCKKWCGVYLHKNSSGYVDNSRKSACYGFIRNSTLLGCELLGLEMRNQAFTFLSLRHSSGNSWSLTPL